MSDAGAWAVLLLLGAFHGINPGMGWLFAVGLGLQEHSRRAVLQALLPIALGHAIAIGAVLLLVAVLRDVAPLQWIAWPIGIGLVVFGVYRFIRSRHPRFGGMRVGFRDLVIWSFLMATAHGAGLMLVPVLFGWADGTAHAAPEHMDPMDHGDHGAHEAAPGGHAEHASGVASTPALAVLATAVHTLGYLAVMAVVAVVVYQKVGLAILRKGWVNLDLIWAGALVVAGVATLLTAL